MPTKVLLAKRAGYHCSNPACRALTTGPERNNDGAVNVGEAAHITAASPGGGRYDSTLTQELRKAPDNGIWLCSKCATLIDKKESDYPVNVLRDWKAHAENAARVGLEIPSDFASGKTNAYTIACVFRYKHPSKFFQARALPLPAGKQYRISMSFEPIGGPITRTAGEGWTPYLLDASFGPSPEACAFLLQLMNNGTGVEPNASIELRMKGAVIWKQTSNNPERTMMLYDCSLDAPTALAGFAVSNLMPGETVSATVFSHKPGPFAADAHHSSVATPLKPGVIDVIFSEPELVDSLPPNPEFDKSVFPFE